MYDSAQVPLDTVSSEKREPQSVRQHLQERANYFEENRKKVLEALETLPKSLLDLQLEELNKVGIYI